MVRRREIVRAKEENTIKVFIVTMLLALAGLFGMGYAQHYIQEEVSEVLRYMENIDKALKREDAAAAKIAHDACCEQFTAMANRMMLFSDHRGLNETRVALGRLGVYIADGEWSGARVSFLETKILLTGISENERPEFKNIF